MDNTADKRSDEEKAGIKVQGPKPINTNLPQGVFVEYPKGYANLNMADLTEATRQYADRSEELRDSIALMEYNLYKYSLQKTQVESNFNAKYKGTINPQTRKLYSDAAIEKIFINDDKYRKADMQSNYLKIEIGRAKRNLISLDAQIKIVQGLTGILNEDYRKKRG